MQYGLQMPKPWSFRMLYMLLRIVQLQLAPFHPSDMDVVEDALHGVSYLGEQTSLDRRL